MEWKQQKTTVDVWRAIMKQHHDELVVFLSFSAPDGDPYGNGSEARMMTEYGFKGADCPLIGADTRWDINDTAEFRPNEHTEYWLCVPSED